MIRTCLLFGLLCGISITMWGQDLVSASLIDTVSLSQQNSSYLLLDNPEYILDVYKIQYTTPDPAGQVDTASGILVVPRDRSLRFPMLAYMHGTVDGPEDVPSRLAGGYSLSISCAATGYIVAAPDFIGYGDSNWPIHPYVHAASEASSGTDLVRAAKVYMDSVGIAYQQQLFITGYSQGGHAGMALQQVIETDFSNEFGLTAASHMSGPYSLSEVMYERTFGTEPYLFPAYLAATITGYQEVYGGLYQNLDEVFKQPYKGYVEDYLAGNTLLFSMNVSMLVSLNFSGAGSLPRAMFQDAYIAAIDTNANHPVRAALRDNDVYDWTPAVPTRMMYCGNDEQVPGQNAVVADSVMNANNATDVEALLVFGAGDHSTCVQPAWRETMNFFAQYAVIDTVTVSSTDFPSLDQQIQFWPNPTQGSFTISMPEGESVSLAIFNLYGQEVWQWEGMSRKTMQFELADLPSGNYVLSIAHPLGRTSRLIQLLE